MIKPYDYSAPVAPLPVASGNIKPFSYAPTPITPQEPTDTSPKLVFGHLEGPTVGTQTTESVKSALTTPTVPQNYFKTISDTFNNAVSEVEKQADIFGSKQSSLLQKGVSVGNTVLQELNVLFSPISAAFNASAGIPVVGGLADGVNRVFAAIGAGTGGAAYDTIQALPISQENKDTLAPFARDVGALVGQILIGAKLGDKAISEIVVKSKALATGLKNVAHESIPKIEPFDYSKVESHGGGFAGQVDANAGNNPLYSPERVTVPEKVAVEPPTSPVEAFKPVETAPIAPELAPLAQEARKYKSAEEFVKGVQGKTIDMPTDFVNQFVRSRGGASIGENISSLEKGFDRNKPIDLVVNGDGTAQLGDGNGRALAAKQLGMKDVPVRITVNNNFSLKDFPESKPFSLTDFYNKVKGQTQTVEPVAGAPKPVETANTQFASRVYERMKAENPDVLTENVTATRTNLKEDAQKAVDLIAKDKQEAFNIAMGAKSSPEVTSTAVNIAMTEKALADGNYKLASELIKNRSLEQTRRGQEIVAERGSVTDNSTSKYVKELIAARLDSLGKTYLGDLKIKRVADKTKAINKIDAEVTKVKKQIKAKKLDTKTALSLLDKLSCV